MESKGKDTTELRDETFRKENLSHFPSCQTMKEKLSTAVFPSAQFADKLNILAADFRRRFADFEAQKSRFELLSNPFAVDMESAPPNLRMELIELQCNDTLKGKYERVGAAEFARFIPDTMPQLLLSKRMHPITGSPFEFLKGCYPSLQSFDPPTEKEIMDIIVNMKDSAAGYDGYEVRDNTIHVESTDIVTPQYRQQLVQVLKRPDLSSEEGWIQVCWGTRKAPKNKVAAKLLLLGVQKKRITATSSLTSDEDETQIDPSQVLQTNPKMTKAARDRALSQLKSSLLRRNPTTSTPLTSEDDTDIDTNVDLFDPPQASGSTISLGNTGVQVSKICFQRLNRTRMSLFTQDLAVLIFGRDVFASSTLTGKPGPTETAKEQLNPEKLSALVDTVIAEFPGTNVSDVRTVIWRKCNNENFVSKKKQ
ncbi:hypothetical protein ABVT39_013458 [Epinephelus coioides]